MDDLDREIEQAAQAARRLVRRRQLATVASTATFLVAGIVGSFVMFGLFPEPDATALDAELEKQRVEGEDPSAVTVAKGVGAMGQDRGRMRWKILPVAAFAFVSANLVRKRLTPRE